MTKEEVHKKILWGAATAAYQVEGATYCDGKGKIHGMIIMRKIILDMMGNLR